MCLYASTVPVYVQDKNKSVPTRCLHTTGPEPLDTPLLRPPPSPVSPPPPVLSPRPSTSTPASTSRTLFSLCLTFHPPCHQLFLAAAGRLGYIFSFLYLNVQSFATLLIHPLTTHPVPGPRRRVRPLFIRADRRYRTVASLQTASHRTAPLRTTQHCSAHPIVYFVSGLELPLWDTSTPPPPPAWWLQLGLVHHRYML